MKWQFWYVAAVVAAVGSVTAVASGAGDGEPDRMAARIAALEKQVAAMSAHVAALQDAGNTEQTMGQAYLAGTEPSVLTFGSRQTAVLALPKPRPAATVPLIVALHGYGAGSSAVAAYSRLHTRVNQAGFALLVPNGTVNTIGKRFWNANDWCCDFYDSGVDDAASLTALVEQVVREHNLGPVYFFGHSNGGSMSHRMACEGIPGLRAVASLAGSDSRLPDWCAGAAPVSVLQISGTEDVVIRFGGNDGEVGLVTGKPEYYLGAVDIVRRWGVARAGCEWPDDPQPYAAMDLDESVPGAETKAYRLDAGCAGGVNVELWVGDGSGHVPAYGEAFTDALIGWLLAQ